MSIAKERQGIETALNSYREQLDTIPDELFTETPPDGGWSFAEVYSHVLKATLASSIALERCTQNTCEPTKDKLTWQGALLLMFGYFPKVTVPEAINDKIPAAKITKEEAKNMIIKCRKRIETTVPLISASNNSSRLRHPVMGMLNARQWFRFIKIHLKHHLKQLERTKIKFE